ncbi:hypothetical protein PALB_6870 [Pseudoalteromonas luteoviolacea B = ATCC 29581]|nr:hypothetical protein PALB_6870 [Pseudoalteromonas luteoviolacea B = ATCC 29581]
MLPTLDRSFLSNNPFFILGVTPRDHRTSIIDAAEELSLELDDEVCNKAKSELTNPRTRLAPELSWFPGLSPRKVKEYLEILNNTPLGLIDVTGVPPLAKLNLLMASIELTNLGGVSESEFIHLYQLIDDTYHSLDLNDIIRDVNEDRNVSRFPDATDYEYIESELSNLRRQYKQILSNSLDSMPTDKLITYFTSSIDAVTNNGSKHPSELIIEVVDSYQVKTRAFLQKSGQEIETLIDYIGDVANERPEQLPTLIEKLAEMARNWDAVAQPIQVSFMSQGIEHEDSNDVARAIRSLGIDLANNYGLFEYSQTITALLQELFSELPELFEKVNDDADVLEDLFQQRNDTVTKNKETQAQWERDIAFRAEIGAVFKDVLEISSNGVRWGNKLYPLDSITRIRWGAVKHSVNGIPTGTTYTLAFGDDASESVVETKKEKVYIGFLDKIWKAVCVRLLTDILISLESNNTLRFGDAQITDNGVTLTKHKLFGSNERIKLTWSDVKIWSAQGSFVIGCKNDKKTYSSMSYIDTPNAHLLEQLIRMMFKDPQARCLSDLLA